MMARSSALPAGLRLLPANWRRAGVAVGCSILGVTAFIVVLDRLIFRSALTPAYLAQYASSPLARRIAAECLVGLIEEVKFRLLLMTALATAAALIWRGRPPAAIFVAIIVAAQFADVWPLVLADPAYASFRYLAVGCVWGWLYWRHGWLAAVVGHLATHLVLDPALMAVLRP